MNTIVKLIINEINYNREKEIIDKQKNRHSLEIEHWIKQHETNRYYNHSLTTTTNITKNVYGKSILIITSVLSSTKPNKYL